MPSTRKQKAKERRSRQLDIMSDVENVDVMLGNYSRNDERNDESENELNLDSESSRPQRNSNATGEDFRSLLTNSRENSEITIETTRMINEEISNQMSFQQQSLIQYFLLFKIRWKYRGNEFHHGGPRVYRATSWSKDGEFQQGEPKVQWATTKPRSKKNPHNMGNSSQKVFHTRKL